MPWWLLAIAFYLAETYVAHLHFRKQAHTLSASEIGLVFGLFFASPLALLAAQTAGAGVALAVHRRQKPVKFAFNLAELSLCAGLAVLDLPVVRRPGDSGRGRGASPCSRLRAHAVGLLLVSAVIAVAEGRFSAPQLPRTLATSLVGVLATTCLGLLGVELINNDPRATPADPPRGGVRARVPRLHAAAGGPRAPRVPLRVDARDAGRAGVRPGGRRAAGGRPQAAPGRLRGDPAVLPDAGGARAAQRERPHRPDAHASARAHAGGR